MEPALIYLEGGSTYPPAWAVDHPAPGGFRRELYPSLEQALAALDTLAPTH